MSQSIISPPDTISSSFRAAVAGAKSGTLQNGNVQQGTDNFSALLQTVGQEPHDGGREVAYDHREADEQSDHDAPVNQSARHANQRDADKHDASAETKKINRHTDKNNKRDAAWAEQTARDDKAVALTKHDEAVVPEATSSVGLYDEVTQNYGAIETATVEAVQSTETQAMTAAVKATTIAAPQDQTVIMNGQMVMMPVGVVSIAPKSEPAAAETADAGSATAAATVAASATAQPVTHHAMMAETNAGLSQNKLLNEDGMAEATTATEQPAFSAMVDNAAAQAMNAANKNAARDHEQQPREQRPSDDLLGASLAAKPNAVATVTPDVAAAAMMPAMKQHDILPSRGNTDQHAMQMIEGGGRKLSPYDKAAQIMGIRTGHGSTVHATEVVEQVAVKLNQQGKTGLDQLTIQLRPTDLGRVEVTLNFQDGAVTGTIMADNQSTLDLLSKDQRVLERALQDAGLKTDSGSLSFQLRDHSNQPNGQQHKSPAHHGQDFMLEIPADAALNFTAAEARIITRDRVNLTI